MNKIIKSLAILTVVGAISAGATVAYFNDTESSTGNSITAGTLNLQLECPAVSTTATVPSSLYPSSGVDTTASGSVNLSTASLNKLKTDNDDRYYPTGEWEQQSYMDSEALAFEMENLPTEATGISGTPQLKIDWRATGDWINFWDLVWPGDGARVKIYNGSTLVKTVDFTQPSGINVDKLEVINLPEFDTVAKMNALKVVFQAHDGGHAVTAHDMVAVDVAYTATSMAAASWCEDGLTGQFVVSNVKPTDVGNPEAIVKYRDEGSIGGKLIMKTSAITDQENTRYGAETTAGDASDDVGELSPYLHLWVNNVDVGTVASLATSPYVIGDLAGGAEGSLTLNWKFEDGEHVNQAQSDGTAFNVDFVLDQVLPTT